MTSRPLPEQSTPRSPVYIVGLMCLAEVLTMLGVFIFPSLMPEFISLWQLTNTEAGWIAGISLAGYAFAVPVLVSLTDRIDARLVYFGGALLTAISLFGFAYAATGFWSAFLLRMLAGFGLAATYMPGLRVLVDRYSGPRQARSVGFYTASFSLGTAVSIFFSGEAGALLGWQGAHTIAGAAAFLAALLVLLAMNPVAPAKPEVATKLLDFRPIFRNREAMGYIWAYSAHIWELFAMRSWIVAFLAFSLTRQPGGEWSLAPTIVATLGALFAMVCSIGGNELCERFGRRRMVMMFLIAAGVTALTVGFTAGLPYWVVVCLMILYAGLIQLDSAALTAGTVLSAENGRRGTTLALHALLGFGAGAIGPLVVGIVLDQTGGGSTPNSWGFAFASVGIVALLGPIALWKLRAPQVIDKALT